MTMNDKELIYTLIVTVKKCSCFKEYTPFQLFEYVLNTCYTYASTHNIAEISYETFKESVYTCLEAGMSYCLPINARQILEVNLRNTEKEEIDEILLKNFIEDVLNDRKSYLCKLSKQVEKQKAIFQNLKDNVSNLWKILENNIINLKYMQKVLCLRDYAKYLNKFNDYSFLFMIFKYGYIEGLRAERRKHHERQSKA